jgi:damage-control phosphatase, subfamily I
MLQDCFDCHIKTVDKLIGKFKPENEKGEKLYRELHHLLTANPPLDNLHLSRQLHQMAKKLLNSSDLYAEEKLQANNLLLEQYGYWKDLVAASEDPFQTAALLSVVGNVIDYGAHSVSEDIGMQVKECFEKGLSVDQSGLLRQKIKKSKHILYLGDNAGEIVFDKLFIETIGHPNITFAVRGKPIINDATYDDAVLCGMDRLCKVVPNGADAPSTLLELCTEEFRQVFNGADLIISKGQGNFEGLMHTDDERIFFLLMAKCLPIAELLRVKKGDMVIKQNIK